MGREVSQEYPKPSKEKRNDINKTNKICIGLAQFPLLAPCWLGGEPGWWERGWGGADFARSGHIFGAPDILCAVPT